MGRPKKIKTSYPDKLIRVDFAINAKQVTIQYLGDVSNMAIIPELENGEKYGIGYDGRKHTHVVIINNQYKCFI